MSAKFRRYFIPKSIVFITQVVKYREYIFQNDDCIWLLREVLRNVKVLHPFNMLGYVFLPDHFHIMFRPTGKSHFDKIMGSLKTNFTKQYKDLIGISGSMRFWQPRFRDHIIRDDSDFEKHLNHIHYNPIKHGLVTHPKDWLHSSFLHWKQMGAYPDYWGWSLLDSIKDWKPV
ncbi:MAG: transposase [Chloroflexota bacterium]